MNFLNDKAYPRETWHKMNLSKDICIEYLKTINGLNFTSREIDIIACLVHGRATKTIASFLSIASRTVETHIRNIMRKLECNSQECIRNFIEKSDKFLGINNHYLNLMIQFEFEQRLQEVLNLRTRKLTLCVIFFNKREQEDRTSFICQIQKNLKLSGIEVVIDDRGTCKPITPFKHNQQAYQNNYVIYIIDELFLNQLQENEEKAKSEISNFIQKHAHNIKNILFLLNKKEDSTDLPQEIQDIGYINCRNYENYHFLIFEILKKLLPDENLEKIINKFNLYYQQLSVSFELMPPIIESKQTKLKHQKNAYYLPQNILRKEKKRIALGGVFCLGVAAFWILSFYHNQPKKIAFSHMDLEMQLIRADLPIPNEPFFVQRPILIKQIDERLQGSGNIQTVALVGNGGAGKTTLARQYAQHQESSVIWEINAETKDSLIHSFEKLAYALSLTDAHQKILKNIQSIQHAPEKEDRILRFVKERLRSNSNWILIYDNVELFADIQKYFPQDFRTWGKGKIILTTRNSNIQNNSNINHVIQIGELKQNQQLDLFLKIMSNGNIDTFTSAQKEAARKFLEEIPSFPLDVSVAAYYLKTTNVSYEQYLENMSKYNKDFADLQENLLKEAGWYTKTRYGIITMSLQQLVETHKDFCDLLLFISLLDSQNIPKELLNTYKDAKVVDSFIYHLKKYSLINNEISSFSKHSFSIHRSTQALSLAYLTKRLGLEKNKQHLHIITNILEVNIADAVDKDDLEKIKSLITHCRMFLTNNILTDNMRASISSSLGCIYYCLSYYEDAQRTLGKALSHLNKSLSHNQVLKAKTLVYLGIVIKTVGDRKKAKDLIERGLTIYTSHLPNNHDEIAWALLNLGDVYRNLGDYEKAKNVLKQSLAIFKKNSPDNYIGKARALLYLGTVYRDLGEYKKAITILEESYSIYQKYVSKDHLRIARILVHMGNLYREFGNYEKAKKLIEQSLAIYKGCFSEDHIDVGWTLTYLAMVYIDSEKYEEAKDLLEQSLIIHKKNYPENHIEMAWVLSHLGDAYKNLAQYEKAEILFEKSLKSYELHYGKNHIETARVLIGLGQFYMLKGKLEVAEDYFLKVLTICQNNRHPTYYKILENLADLYLKKTPILESEKDIYKSKHFKEQAINYLKESLKIMEAYLPNNSPRIIKIQNKINAIGNKIN